MGLDAIAGQQIDHRLFQGIDQAADAQPQTAQVEQGIDDPLTGPVIGDLSAAVAEDDGNISWREDMFGPGVHTQGIDRRMLHEPQRIRSMGVALIGVLAHRLPHGRVGRQSPIPDLRWGR
jgi:hypothetical protein